MAKLSINVSGRRGLLERFQGDLNDTTAQPNLRYIGEDGQFAEGIFNPTKVYGYLSPANNRFASLTGTVANPINSIQYEAELDVVYLSETGLNILQLSSLTDTSLSNYLTISTGTIRDMMLYEINGRKALLYVIDSGSKAYEISPSALTSSVPDEFFGGVGGMYVGFRMLGTTDEDIAIEFNRATINTTSSTAAGGEDSAINDGSSLSRKLAQAFSTDTVITNIIEKVGLKLFRNAGTGVGITLKLSIQTDAERNVSPYNYRGAWVTATSYAVNDVVTQTAKDFVCFVAHTSGATTQPEIGDATENNWQRFGAPTGTEVASTTISATVLPGATSNLPGFSFNTFGNILTHDRVFFTFSTPVTLTANTIYWLVLEESGTVMTAADTVSWWSTVNDASAYVADALGKYAKYNSPTISGFSVPANFWANPNFNDQGQYESRDFLFAKSRVDDWSMNLATGHFIVQPNQESFLYLAENSLMYWFVGNKVHTLDGGITGGIIGRGTKEVLNFPSYLNVIDVAETRSRMYIGIQSSKRTTVDDKRYYDAEQIGVFVWDRRSQVFGGTDFYPTPGAKEIKKLFKSSNGDVKCITTNNSGFCEIRAINGNQYQVIRTFEANGFPVSRRSVSQLNGLTVWLGANGIFYGYGSTAIGEPEELYKIGNMAGETASPLTTGPILVGNENAAEPQSAILFGWSDTVPTRRVQKWYPHGDGTINSVAQVANRGDVYTKVYDLGSPMNVRYAHIYFAPISGGVSTQAVATIKVFYNKSTTVGATFTILRKDLTKGYFYMPLGEKNIYAIQFELGWDTTQTLGTTDFMPNTITVDYDEEKTKKK